MDDIVLTGSKATFDVNIIGDMTKQPYIGTFVVKCYLNPLEYGKADSLYRELLGQVHPAMASERATENAFALSQLKHLVIECPAFWENRELNGGHVDENVIYHVLNMAFKAREKYLGKTIERAKEMKDQLHNSIVAEEFDKELKEAEENELLDNSLKESLSKLGDL